MANQTTNISIRMDVDLKNAAEELFDELGLSLSAAFHIFVRQALRERSIPFTITERTPNQETVNAMLEAKRIARDPNIQKYSDVEEALKELKK